MPEDCAPLVTVITPCLNSSAWLPTCIESVARQTAGSIEHIVIDGGSTDDTLDVLARYPHVRWQSEPDSGQSDAINKGIALARGELVTWLNADDTLEPNAVAAVLAAWRRHPNASVFYGDLAIVAIGRTQLWTPRTRIRPEDFDHKLPLPQVGTFITSDALTAVGGVDDRLHLAMDFDLFLRLAVAGNEFVYTGKTLARFALHSTSKSGANVHGEFFREEARALRSAGRAEAASVATGRASALAASLPDGGWRPGYWAATRGTPLAERAGAHLEATRLLLESRSTLRAVPHWASPSLWRCATTRRGIAASLRRLPQRMLHRWRVSR